MRIQVEGLVPGDEYVLGLKRRSVTVKTIKYWESNAIFHADDFGIIPLSELAPLYSGIDSMGLFWSMEVVKTEDNINGPYKKLTPQEFLIYVEHNGNVMVEKPLTRLWYSSDVIQTPVREKGLVGTFFHLKEGIPHPGIIVVGGSEGGSLSFWQDCLHQTGLMYWHLVILVWNIFRKV